jgi:GNAT superfamily N-acetyltransferase
MADLRLEELSAATIVAANSLTLRPGQEQFVTPPSYAIADAVIDPMTSWPRVVLDGDTVVGFIRGNFDDDNPLPEFRSCIWRINVAADAQGAGIGKFAIMGLADEARRLEARIHHHRANPIRRKHWLARPLNSSPPPYLRLSLRYLRVT